MGNCLDRSTGHGPGQRSAGMIGYGRLGDSGGYVDTGVLVG